MEQSTHLIAIITIENRNYDSWCVHKMETMEAVNITTIIDTFDPATLKLFSMDVFVVDEHHCHQDKSTYSLRIERSPIRASPHISGVLVLKNNRTYGRHQKNGKLLYKCIPDDKRIPIFLVPYEIKHVGFNKVQQNMYVTFKFVDWTDKHPFGSIVSTIGQVDVLVNYFEYQLFCKSLNASIQRFTRDTHDKINTIKGRNSTSEGEEAIIDTIVAQFASLGDGGALVDRTRGEYIFSIDPTESTDFDDAVSCVPIDPAERTHNGAPLHRLSIYISNVTLLLDSLGLWNSFSERVSTIYLPDRKRPMLPTILSDGLCSLVQDKTRLAFAMDIYVADGRVVDVQYTNTKIRVAKNYRYDDKALGKCKHYSLVMDIAQKMLCHQRCIPVIRDSHDLVAYLMIFMNYNTAKTMLPHRNGIFRNVISEVPTRTPFPDSMDQDVLMFFKTWNSGSAQYVDLATLGAVVGTELRHDMLEMDAYIHITSPIRRLVDLLNMIQIQNNIGLRGLSEDAHQFYNHWVARIEYINTTMRSIRKLQNECTLVASVFNNPELVNKEYTGYVFDKTDRGGVWQYNVYIHALKWMTKITTCVAMDDYNTAKFRLHLFQDEDSVKRKLRVSIVPADESPY